MTYDKCKTEIEKLFTEKLNPAIAPAVEARNAITQQRQKIEADRQNFLKKIEVATESISTLEANLDEKIINGKSPDETLLRINTRQGELRAYERQIQRLQGEDTDAAMAEETANQELSKAIGKALEALRPDVEGLIMGKINEVLATMVYFNHIGDKTADDYGVTLQKDVELSVYRFLSFDQASKDLQAYMGSVGEDMSAVMRYNVRKEFFARLAEEQTEKAAA